MEKLKLYTEEQVRKIFETLSDNTGYDYSMEDYVFNVGLTPIKLPSDEEIDKEASDVFIFGADQGKFISGANWVIEQIKQQNI